MAKLHLPFLFAKAVLARAAVAKLCAGERHTVILCYNQDYYLASLLHTKGLAFIQQYCERKLPNEFKGGKLNPHYWSLHAHMRHAPHWSSGDIVISSALREAVRLPGKREPVIIPPLMLESSSMTVVKEHTVFTFTYLGAGAKRDMIPEMLSSARSLYQRRCDFRLCLAGLQGSAYTHARRWQMEHSADWLTVRPFVDDSELENIRNRTDAWVLLRKNDASGQAAFPTRLCEYLLTPKPVIFSDVGDLSLYTGDEGAVLVSGEEASKVEAAFLDVLTRRDALRVAANRRMQKAAAAFSPEHYASNLDDVITAASLQAV